MYLIQFLDSYGHVKTYKKCFKYDLALLLKDECELMKNVSSFIKKVSFNEFCDY